MVRHQDERVDIALPLSTRVPDASEELQSIVVTEEDRLSIVASDNQVLR